MFVAVWGCWSPGPSVAGSSEQQPAAAGNCPARFARPPAARPVEHHSGPVELMKPPLTREPNIGEARGKRRSSEEWSTTQSLKHRAYLLLAHKLSCLLAYCKMQVTQVPHSIL